MSISTNISLVTSSLNSFNDHLTSSDLLRKIAISIQASNIERIHENGKAVDGSDIGSYSTAPTYISKSPKKVSPKGKNGKTKFKNGNTKKSAYFSNGYKGFRDEIGRDTSSVNLSLTGKLSKEFGIVANGNSGFSVGFTTPYATDLSKAHEKKYAKQIWGLSGQDEKDIQTIIKAHINGGNI